MTGTLVEAQAAWMPGIPPAMGKGSPVPALSVRARPAGTVTALEPSTARMRLTCAVPSTSPEPEQPLR
jgi:hypothetical protein